MERRSSHADISPHPWDPEAGTLWLLVAVFFLLGLLVLLRHEMWQDEWQAWLLAKTSSSLGELFQNRRYEGHPCLWYMALFLTSRFTTNPLGIQLLHLMVATGAVYVFLKYSPFTRLQKILFIFGYFPFYEYCVISRNYGLGVLGIFSFCAVFGAGPPRRYLLLAIILFLLSQTSVYGLIIAALLGVILGWEVLSDRSARTWRAAATLGLVMLGLCLSLLQLPPPEDSGFAVGWKVDVDLPYFVQTLAAVWKSYAPLPAPDYHFWNTNFIPAVGWQGFLSLILLSFGILLFIRQPMPLFLYTAGTAGILAFAYVKYPGSLRHHGQLFLLLMASLWLSAGYPQKKVSWPRFRAWADSCRAHRDQVVSALLIVHLIAGVAAASLDVLFPFSESREAARFITEHHLEDLPILGHRDDAASSVAGYLGRPIYYLASRRWGTFVIWNQEQGRELVPERLMQQAEDLSRQRCQDVLLLLNYELPVDVSGPVLLQKFTGSLYPKENYYLYRVGPP